MRNHDKEPMAGAGFSDYIRAAKQLGHDALARSLGQFDAGEQSGSRNPHCVITDRIKELGLPTQSYLGVSIEKFLSSPTAYLSQLPEGDYYFASIVSGTHLAHGNSPEEVISFVQEFAASHPHQYQETQELYLSHNGEPVMSAHINIQDESAPNAGYIEATIGNFNAFHRGSHSPEIIARHVGHSYEWEFRDALQPEGDWHDSLVYPCNGGVWLTREQMASHIYEALGQIPHDGDYYLPGYYEVLFERTPTNRLRPAFIEAVLMR